MEKVNEHITYEHEVRVSDKCEFIPEGPKGLSGIQEEYFYGVPDIEYVF